MMKYFFTIAMSILIMSATYTQSLYHKATLNEDGTIHVETIKIDAPSTIEHRKGENEPFLQYGGVAFPISKNSRGATLADINGDDVKDIIFSIYDTLYAMKGDGSMLFKKGVSGPILLPPAIADIDGNEDLEIAVNYGYPRNGGGIILLDNEGNNLPGWPQSFNSHWMINAPVFSDLDGDGVMEIISVEYVSSTEGYVHVFKLDGSPYNENWPIDIGAPPAFTPSVGDINNDGIKEIVIAGSSNGMHVFNPDGKSLPGFPIDYAGVNYSYQSPILADLNGDKTLEIIGSNHGDSSAFYVMKADGTYLDGWPYPLNNWTYAPPTVADINGDGEYEIFIGSPAVNSDKSPLPVIYGFHPDGTSLDHFPIVKYGGNEAVITVADVNNDGVMDLVFSSNITDEEGYGFIHAYSTGGSGELEGFPLRPRGFTFLNGAVLGDVDNNGELDVSVISYTLNFGAATDSIFVNVYNLDYPYIPENILRNGYKGSNTRDGLIPADGSTGIQGIQKITGRIYPNPSEGVLNINLNQVADHVEMTIYNSEGKAVYKHLINLTDITLHYPTLQLPAGVYYIHLSVDGKSTTFKWIKQ